MLNGLRWLPENVSTRGEELAGIIVQIDSLMLARFSLTMGTSSRRSHRSP
jgi:hypothetical protein